MSPFNNQVQDPACGKTIDATKAASQGHVLVRDGATYYFGRMHG
jgi:YHS domain-containing protein